MRLGDKWGCLRGTSLDNNRLEDVSKDENGIELRGRLLGTAFQSQLNEKHGIHETIVTDTEVVSIQRLIMSQRTAQEDQQLQNSNFKETEARMRIARRALQFIRYGMRPSDDGNGD